MGLENLHFQCSVKVLVTQSGQLFADPTDCTPTGSSAEGILQARLLEWIAVPFSKGSSQPRDSSKVMLMLQIWTSLFEGL